MSQKISVMTISHSKRIITSLDFFNVRSCIDILTHFPLMVFSVLFVSCIISTFLMLTTAEARTKIFVSSSSSSFFFIAVIVYSRRCYWYLFFFVCFLLTEFSINIQKSNIHINYWEEQFFFCDWLIQFASENERDISLLGSFLHFHSSYYKIFVLSQKIIRKNLYRKEARKIREWNQ